MAKSRGRNAPPKPDDPEAQPPSAPDDPEAQPPSAPDDPAPLVADPRPPREARPGQRVYAVAFGRVWLAALSAAAATRRWTVTSSNPVRGEISIEARGLLRRTSRAARVLVALDDLGLTRVDAAFLAPSGEPAGGAEPRQIERFHRRLEALLRRQSPA